MNDCEKSVDLSHQFEVGDYVIYDDGFRVEFGRITRSYPDMSFVCYKLDYCEAFPNERQPISSVSE